jgi:hypothetical protein
VSDVLPRTVRLNMCVVNMQRQEDVEFCFERNARGYYNFFSSILLPFLATEVVSFSSSFHRINVL